MEERSHIEKDEKKAEDFWEEKRDELGKKAFKVETYFEDNFCNVLKDELSRLAETFFSNKIKLSTKDFIVVDNRLKFLYNGNEYDLEAFCEFLLTYADDLGGKKFQFWDSFFSVDCTTQVGKCFLQTDSKVESDCKEEILNDEYYVSKMKELSVKGLKEVSEFIKSKFKNFDNNNKVRVFVNKKLESIEKNINKINTRFEKAYNLYKKHKEKIKLLEKRNRAMDNKIDFLVNCVLLSDGALRQKYDFLRYENLNMDAVEGKVMIKDIPNNFS